MFLTIFRADYVNDTDFYVRFLFSLFRVIFNIQSILAVYPQVQKVKPFQHGGSHKIITINGRFVVLRFFFFFNFVFFDGGRRPKIGVDGTKFNVESAVFLQFKSLPCDVTLIFAQIIF